MWPVKSPILYVELLSFHQLSSTEYSIQKVYSYPLSSTALHTLLPYCSTALSASLYVVQTPKINFSFGFRHESRSWPFLLAFSSAPTLHHYSWVYTAPPYPVSLLHSVYTVSTLSLHYYILSVYVLSVCSGWTDLLCIDTVITYTDTDLF